jgi:hypothetical protein
MGLFFCLLDRKEKEMFGFTCLIKTDTDLVKRCLQESKNDVELLTALYDEVLDTDTDAEGMWPTEELATPVEEYSLIFGCREASELIYFAEGMRKRALYSAIGAASLALKRWNEAGINIKTSLEEVLNTIPMGSTEAYTLSCATDILCNTPCPEANELFYNGYRWSCCPNDFELDDIIKHPEQYIVVPVLFAEQ